MFITLRFFVRRGYLLHALALLLPGNLKWIDYWMGLDDNIQKMLNRQWIIYHKTIIGLPFTKLEMIGNILSTRVICIESLLTSTVRLSFYSNF